MDKQLYRLVFLIRARIALLKTGPSSDNSLSIIRVISSELSERPQSVPRASPRRYSPHECSFNHKLERTQSGERHDKENVLESLGV